MWNMNLLIILFFISILMYSSMYKHLLMALISLEFIILNLTLLIYYNLFYLKLNMFFMSFFWTISVCESIMGLTILVFLVRKMGNDFTKLINIIN